MSSTLTREVTVDGKIFNMPIPWKMGDKLNTEADAFAINTQWVENIGNTCRKKIKDMSQKDAEAHVTKYAKTYAFTKTETGRSKDPVVAQMAIVAAAWAKAELKAAGLVHDIPAVKVKAVEVMIDREDKVRERATKMIAREAALLVEDIPNEDLDGVGES